MASPLLRRYTWGEFVKDMIVLFLFFLVLYGMLCVVERYENKQLPLKTEQEYNEKAKENLGRVWLCQ